MKKVSTVAVKQSRNISQPKLTIGLDLGDRNSWYCMVDEAGRSDGSSESARMRKGCRKSSERCRAAGSRSKPGRIRALAVHVLEVGKDLNRAVLREPNLGSQNRMTLLPQPFDRACRECGLPCRFVKGDEGG